MSKQKNINEFYRLIAEKTSDFISINEFNLKVPYIYVSPSFWQLGYEPEELIGVSGFKFIHPEDLKNLKLLLQKYLKAKIKNFLNLKNKDNIVERIKYRYKAKTGEWRYLESTVNIADNNKLIFVSKDISRRIKIENKLKNNEEKFKQIFYNLPFIAFTLNKKGRLIEANKQAEKTVGIKIDKYKNKPFYAWDLLNKEDILVADREFSKNLRGKVTDKTIYQIKRLDEKKKEIELIGIPLFENNEVVGVLDVGEDVTTKRLIESRVAAEREKAARYLDIAGTIILALNSQGNVILINKKGSELLGAKKKDIIGKNWFDNFIPPEQKSAVQEVFNKLKKGEKEEVEYHENEIITRLNERKLIGWHNTYLKNEKGEISVILSSGEDITERRKMEKKFIELAKKWEETMNFLSGGVSIHMPDFTIADVNQSLCQLLGKTKKEIIGRKCYHIFHNKDKPITGCPMLKSTQSKQKEKTEIFEPQIGKWLAVAAVPVLDETGNITRTIHEVRDITEQKQAEEELKKRNKELERFNRLMVGRELKMVELKKKIKQLKEGAQTQEKKD